MSQRLFFIIRTGTRFITDALKNHLFFGLRKLQQAMPGAYKKFSVERHCYPSYLAIPRYSRHFLSAHNERFPG